MPYADAEYYKQRGVQKIPEDEITASLITASRHIDSLTYNRIVGRGLCSFTEFQQNIVREVCCELADFEYENADLLESAISGYSLNGASVQFGNANVCRISGVAIPKDSYALLMQTGLCCRLAR